MKSISLLIFLGIVLFSVTLVYGDCGDAPKDADDGEVKAWFKNLGCKIQKGAGDLQESAKPWAEKISTSAKEFGNTVAQKYDDIKHKITDDNNPAATSSNEPVVNPPLRSVPLAPLDYQPSPSSPNAYGSPGSQPTYGTIGETTTPQVDTRFILQQISCPQGQVQDHRGQCRAQI